MESKRVPIRGNSKGFRKELKAVLWFGLLGFRVLGFSVQSFWIKKGFLGFVRKCRPVFRQVLYQYQYQYNYDYYRVSA